jgi:hypothetical protein
LAGNCSCFRQSDIDQKLAFDTGIYLVPARNGLDVPDYVRTDVRLDRRPPGTVETGLACQNLFNRRLEFAPTNYTRPSEHGSAVQLKVTWAF